MELFIGTIRDFNISIYKANKQEKHYIYILHATTDMYYVWHVLWAITLFDLIWVWQGILFKSAMQKVLIWLVVVCENW